MTNAPHPEQADFTPDNMAAAGAVGAVVDEGYVWPEDPRTRAALEHWRSLKFGVIMHWGLYSMMGQDGSWSLCRENKGTFMDPPASWTGSLDDYAAHYRELRREFSGQDYRAADWSAACARAGMKYLVFTSKHHDGFSMYDTAESDYKSTAPDVPLGRDILRETFDAFRAEGLETGVYFSKADWAHPNYWKSDAKSVDRFHNYDIAEDPESWDSFVQFTQRQIDELLTNYGDINVLWLDAGWVKAPEEPIGIDAIAENARRRQPDILVVDRVVHGVNENYRTPEQEVPAETLDYPWESCITLTPGWCSMRPEEVTRPVHQIIETLATIVSRGGNYLLGIGPDATGALSSHIVAALEEVGAWMDVNSEAIYDTVPGGAYLVVASDGGADLTWRTTRTATALYAIGLLGSAEGHGSAEILVRTSAAVARVRLLGHEAPLEFTTDDGGATRVLLPPTGARNAVVLAFDLAAAGE